MNADAQYALLGLAICGAALRIAGLIYSIRVPSFRIWPIQAPEGPYPTLLAIPTVQRILAHIAKPFARLSHS